MKLVLHAGLPKTATSSLQFALYQTRNRLSRNGIVYPDDVVFFRHQFIITSLLADNFNANRLERFLRKADEDDTLLLSSEGFSNHLFDFTDSAAEDFRNFARHYSDFQIYLVTRCRKAWLKSFYKQCLMNPTRPEFLYGTALLFSEFCELPRVRRLADFKLVGSALVDTLGGSLVELRYEETSVSDMYHALTGQHCPPDLIKSIRINPSVSDTVAELARQINSLCHRDQQARDKLIGALSAAANHDPFQSNMFEKKYRKEPTLLVQFDALCASPEVPNRPLNPSLDDRERLLLRMREILISG